MSGAKSGVAPGTPADGDTNLVIAGLLRDLAETQASTQRAWGYKQAAYAILALDDPIERLVQPDGALAKIARIGPSSTRVILEVLATGQSALVEGAVEASGRRDEIERRRGLRQHFLSRARVRAVLADNALVGPQPADYRGDLRMHSTWSDGSQTLEAIVEAGRAQGYAFSAVTDHSGGLPIANGLSPERFAAQRVEIDRLNDRSDGAFRLLAGVEANIRADGTRVRRGHGERSGHRDRRRSVPAGSRLRSGPRGGRRGCLIALDTDAHAVSQWHYADIAMAHARLAGVPTDRVVNTWTLDRLLDWAAQRSKANSA